MTAVPVEASAPDTARIRGQHQRQSRRGLLLVAPALLVMAIFIIVPAVISVGGTFFVAGEGLRLGNYRDFFGNPQSTGNLLFTIEVTLVALGLLLAIGLGI